MKSQATTVEQYLSGLPEDRRRAIAAVREVILENLDQDFEEGMQYGMIGYYVPHRIHPGRYHADPRQPLPFACLASQKNYMSLYLMSIYGSGEHLKWFKVAWQKSGKKLDRGKSCVRFNKLEDLALDVIGEAIRRVPAKKYIAICESARQATRTAKCGKSTKLRAASKSKAGANSLKKVKRKP